MRSRNGSRARRSGTASTARAAGTEEFEQQAGRFLAEHSEAAGIEHRQAEAIAEGMREAVDAATGADREALGTKADLAALESRVDAKLAALEARLTWCLIGIAASIVAAVKLIPGLD